MDYYDEERLRRKSHSDHSWDRLRKVRVERCREILRSEDDPNKALNLVCEYILSYEPWRFNRKYDFTMVELLELRKAWGLFHA